MHGTYISIGERGTDGRGGKGGRESRNGNSYHIRIRYVSYAI